MQRSLWLPFPNPSTYQSSMVPIQTQSQYSIGWQDTMAFFIATFTIYLCGMYTFHHLSKTLSHSFFIFLFILSFELLLQFQLVFYMDSMATLV